MTCCWQLRPQDAATRDLLQESDSLDTVANAIFSACLLRDRGVAADAVVAVTSSYHAPRALSVFRRAFCCPVSVYGVSDVQTRIELSRSVMLKSFDEVAVLRVCVRGSDGHVVCSKRTPTPPCARPWPSCAPSISARRPWFASPFPVAACCAHRCACSSTCPSALQQQRRPRPCQWSAGTL